MKVLHSNYLKQFDLEKPLLVKIDNIIQFYSKLGIDSFSIFLSETYNEIDKRREIISLWLYNSDYLCEAKSLTKSNNFDIVPYKNRLQALDYTSSFISESLVDFKSSVILWGRVYSDATFEMKASGQNCLELLRIFREIFVPNLEKNKSNNI